MDNIIYVTGHKNPDSDSICAAIAYADYKRKLGYNAVPVRLGELNRETQFVLQYFEVDPPEYLSTVKTQVSDLNLDIVNPITSDISIKTAWNIMKKNNIRTLPVLDDNEKLIGIVTLSDITNKYMDALDNNIIASSKTSLMNIVETLNATLLCGSKDDFKATGKVVIAAVNPEEMDNYIEKDDIVIAGTRTENVKKAIELDANCIILTNGARIDETLLEAARNKKCVIMVTQADTFTTARLINQSVPVGYVMTSENIIKFNINDFADEIKDKMLATRYRSYPVVDDNNRIKGFVSRYHLISHRKKKVILVDHNEKSQTVNGIEQAEILEIIDHHRLGDIQTANPIFFKNEPVGSTSTIIANMYFDTGMRPSKKIAGILCAAIISDTLNFKSPTSTYVDKLTAEKLADIAGIDIKEFSLNMFAAGSVLHEKSPEEIFLEDFKEFKLGKYVVGISQAYTIDFDSLNEIKDSIVEYMNNFCKVNRYNLVILIVTDILKQGSEIIYAGESKELVAKAFNVDISKSYTFLPGVVSRKKQIIPKLSMAIAEL